MEQPSAEGFGLPVSAIMASISDGFVTLSDDWRFTYVNAAAESLWGVRAADLVGRTIYDALKVAPDNPFHRIYLAAKASGEPVSFSAFSDILGGWLQVRGVPFDGGFAIFFRDVTERRATHLAAVERERALRKASATNRRIFETSLDLIYVTDSQGNFVQVSPSAASILGYQPAEMEGRSAIEFIHPEDLDPTREQVRQARRHGDICSFDCRYVHKDGHAVSLSWKGVWSAAAQQHYFIGRDMTERIAAEAQLRHAQRLEAVGRLTGTVAHDFNNLLSVVLGNLDLVLERDDVSETVKEHVQDALHAARRGAEVTRGLLAFSRQQPLHPATLRPDALMTDWARVLGGVVGEDVEVVFSHDAGIWPVHIDPTSLESAITNLALNARDAMPNGGRLHIEMKNTALDADYVRLNPEAVPGDYVVIAVSDTGAGMPPEVLDRIFEPFFTTKDAHKGTGLGLSMVFGFVKQSGGHIKAYSEVGLGTSIWLYLPRAPGVPEAADEPTEAAPQAGIKATHEHILVVEDNEMIRALVLRQLANLGYQAIAAGNGTEALAIIDSDAPIDLLFTDVVMPGGISGHDLAQQAMARRPGLKVLFTSGFPGGALDAISDPNLQTKVLAKPYRLRELGERVRQALDG